MSISERHNYLTYKSPQGVEIVPYKGKIINVEADAIVTRDDDVMEEPSGVTKALIDKYPEFQEKRDTLKKKTKFLFFRKRLKLWSIHTTKLPNSSNSVKFVFHAIMNLDSDCSDANHEENMKKMFLSLLRKSEKYEIKVLALPLFGKIDANPVAKIALKCISDHKPTHLQKVVLVTTFRTHISKIISCCQINLPLIHGNQPDGQMEVTTNANHLPGFDKNGTIVITYTFSDGTQGDEHPNPGKPYTGTRREAYLPDSTDGREVLALLRTAFDRKLTFTIGRSATTGQENVVKWNGIKHKTNKDGGPTGNGFPDPHYLTNLRFDLAKRGITKGRHVPVSHSLTNEKKVTTTKALTKGPSKRLDTKPEAGNAEEFQIDLEALKRELNKRNLVVRDNGAKGNCMFESLSQQIKHVLKRDIGHQEVRNQLVRYFRENPTMPSGTPYADFVEDKRWDDYLKKMATDGEWGDHLMLTAAANLFKVAVVVIKPNGQDTVVEPHGDFINRFFLGHLQDRHYVSLTS